jgi:predicted SPOUT superfamily RNA methylase MTH1
MRLLIHGKRLGDQQEIAASAVVACLDSGAPVAVLAEVEGRIALQTAKDKSFGFTLEQLGFDVRAPETVKQVNYDVNEHQG